MSDFRLTTRFMQMVQTIIRKELQTEQGKINALFMVPLFIFASAGLVVVPSLSGFIVGTLTLIVFAIASISLIPPRPPDRDQL